MKMILCNRMHYKYNPTNYYLFFHQALLSASRKGLTEQIVELLEAGANIMATDQNGRSSLHLATKFGCEGSVRALLKYGKFAIRVSPLYTSLCGFLVIQLACGR